MADASFDFRTWIREQPHRGYEADLADEDRFRLSTDFAVAEINFYAMDPDPEVVEFRIEERVSGEVRFFLHFHAVERDHSEQLFREMVQTLTSLSERAVTEVLLCCTAGMTTSFFAERLNQVAEAAGLDWHFSAVSVNEAYEHGHDKAAVLVAPQIAYQLERVRQVMRDVPVLAIPTATFAAYDAAGCLEWLRDELASVGSSAHERPWERAVTCEGNSQRILVLATHAARSEVNLHCRIYDHGAVEVNQKVIKRRLTLADVTDAIDTQICVCKGGRRVDAIGIAFPGALHGGALDLVSMREINLVDGAGGLTVGDYLSARYQAPVFLINNANAAALGWYASQDEFEDVTFYSQAAGWAMGGQGHVVGGHLVEGAHGIAGELKYVVERFRFSRPLHFNPYDPTDVGELAAQVLAMDCATFDPEVIAVRCDLLPDMEELATELARYIPRDLQPRLVHVDNYNECILAGVLTRCLERMAEKKA